MITTEKLQELANPIIEETQNGELFLVELTISTGGAIEITIDSDTRVSIDQCVVLSRTINAKIEELWGENIMENYSLLVTSAGIGYPLKHPRQFAKCNGKETNIVMKNGEKFAGTMTYIDHENITIKYDEKISVEGKKRKEIIQTEKNIKLSDTKNITEILTIK